MGATGSVRGKAIGAAPKLLEGDWKPQRQEAFVHSLTTWVTQWGLTQTLPGLQKV